MDNDTRDEIAPEDQFLDTRQFLEEASLYNIMPSEQSGGETFSCGVEDYQQNVFNTFPSYPTEQYMPGTVNSNTIHRTSLPIIYDTYLTTSDTPREDIDTITANRRYTEGTLPKYTNKRQKSKRKSTEPVDEQRRQFLERNRIAALKCRQRKKQWLGDLQNRVEFLATDNEQLQSQAMMLKEEVINLKTLLLAHQDCKVAQANGTTIHAIQNAALHILPSISSSSSSTDTSNTLNSSPSKLGKNMLQFPRCPK
ncbi:hypothetical protein G6F56_006920 [Rhizopus delemar]|uniref:BZIP domain-containing protein n=1 Tax=Rhizopus stolonifer TaxID=4846 RepID=A0A367IMX4_RHIST|nr:hypothetical protein G6F56_006920 [Rhizopus delemar]RCH79024.1 hypothetical protein CU098_002969 [Rhizopus stolonifer]